MKRTKPFEGFEIASNPSSSFPVFTSGELPKEEEKVDEAFYDEAQTWANDEPQAGGTFMYRGPMEDYPSGVIPAMYLEVEPLPDHCKEHKISKSRDVTDTHYICPHCDPYEFADLCVATYNRLHPRETSLSSMPDEELLETIERIRDHLRESLSTYVGTPHDKSSNKSLTSTINYYAGRAFKDE